MPSSRRQSKVPQSASAPTAVGAKEPQRQPATARANLLNPHSLQQIPMGRTPLQTYVGKSQVHEKLPLGMNIPRTESEQRRFERRVDKLVKRLER